MQSLKIDLGTVKLAVNDDPEKVIEFNPTDVGMAERFYELISEFNVKKEEYQKKSFELDPENVEGGLSLLHEICEYMRGKIDYVFGDGTSQKAFGNAMVLDMFEQFFAGITPYIQKARSEKVKQYTNRAQKRTKTK